MAKKKKASKKKVKAKATTHLRNEKTETTEILVVAPDDVEREPVAAPAIADEPECYSRSKGGQTKHMTLAEHKKLHG